MSRNKYTKKDLNVPEPWVSHNESGKIAICYSNHKPPTYFFETDEKGIIL